MGPLITLGRNFLGRMSLRALYTLYFLLTGYKVEGWYALTLSKCQDIQARIVYSDGTIEWTIRTPD